MNWFVPHVDLQPAAVAGAVFFPPSIGIGTVIVGQRALGAVVLVPGHDGGILHMVLPGCIFGDEAGTSEIEGCALVIDVDVLHGISFR